jgi:hypothetical protein
LLVQSRASRISDVLTLRDVNEIAESPPGAVQDAVTRKIKEEIKEIAATGTTPPLASTDPSGTVRYASVKDGKAEFDTTVPKSDIKASWGCAVYYVKQWYLLLHTMTLILINAKLKFPRKAHQSPYVSMQRFL